MQCTYEFKLEASIQGGSAKFCISASTEATKMYNLSNFLFLGDQSIGAVSDYPKWIFYALFIKNVKYIGTIFLSNHVQSSKSS